MSNKVLLLYSSLTSDAVQEQGQRRAHALLTAKGIEFTEIDGADPRNIEKRNELFRLGRKARYPQIYIERSDGKINYVGGWEEVEAMNECCDMPKEILRANPHIQTFDQVFIHVKRTKRNSLGLPPAASSYS
ncbi:Hypothetical protein NocV09_04000480 [Nannochloropsis oceanica]